MVSHSLYFAVSLDQQTFRARNVIPDSNHYGMLSKDGSSGRQEICEYDRSQMEKGVKTGDGTKF